MKFKSDKQRKAVMSKMKERNGSSQVSASTLRCIRELENEKRISDSVKAKAKEKRIKEVRKNYTPSQLKIIDKVNKSAISPIELDTGGDKWLGGRIDRHKNHEVFKHLSTDKSSLEHFDITLEKENLDTRQPIVMVDVEYLKSIQGNKLGGIIFMGRDGDEKFKNKLERMKNAFDTKTKVPVVALPLEDSKLGEGNHRVNEAQRRGFKSVPVHIYWS